MGLEAPARSLTCPGLAGDGDLEQIDFIDSNVPGEDEERSAAEVRSQGWPWRERRRVGSPCEWGQASPASAVPPQEQLPSEVSLVAGDVEKPSSSRYPSPHAHSPASSAALGTSPSPDKGLSVLSSARREEPAGEERRRPDTLQLWQERERRQQQQSGGWGSPRKDG